MPAESQAQQSAAGIALAVRKGKMSIHKLRKVARFITRNVKESISETLRKVRGEW